MKTMSSPEKLERRPVGSEDLPFLFRVYASTRQEELALVDWDEARKKAFLRMQFEAQDKWYRENYTNTEFSILALGGEPIGRLYLARWKEEIRIVDIALSPDHRNRGFGSKVLKVILEEGRETGKKVTIHVERFNPALRLYARLGFEVVEDKGVYLLLEWRPM